VCSIVVGLLRYFACLAVEIVGICDCKFFAAIDYVFVMNINELG